MRFVAIAAIFASLAPAVAQVEPPVSELTARVRSLAQRTEVVFEDRFERVPRAARVTDEAMAEALAARLDALVPAERRAARGRAWRELGLGDGGTPEALYRILLADLPGFAVAGGHTVAVAEGRLEGTRYSVADDRDATLALSAGFRIDEPQAVHALVHLRQFERAGGEPYGATTDAMLATAALAEGEANVAALRFAFADMGLADTVVARNVGPDAFLEGRLMPPGLSRMSGVLRRLVDFVWLDGYSQVAAAFRTGGGWGGVAALFERGVSTRALMVGGGAPLEIATPASPAEGFTLADRDTLGHQVGVVLLATMTGKDSLAMESVEGWAGDALLRWESSDDAVTEWLSAWVTDEAAADFEYGLVRALTARFNTELDSAPNGARFVQGGRRTFVIDREGKRVRLRVADAELAATWLR